MFEGNIEEQARILCKQFMKREILDHLPPDPEPEPKDEQESDADMQHDNENGNAAGSMEVEDLAAHAEPGENGIAAGAKSSSAAA